MRALSERLQYCCRCRGSGRESEGIFSVFQGCYGSLKVIPCIMLDGKPTTAVNEKVSIPVRVRASAVFVGANGLSHCCLCESGR